MTPLSLSAVIDDLDNLPSAPAVVTQLTEYFGREEVDSKVVAHLISQDPALAAKCLALANSSVYGIQRRVSSINDALSVVGLQAITTMVSSMAVAARFQNLKIPGYELHNFWLHSICTALSARALAKVTRINPETAFTAGLLHDIGKLVLAARFPEHFSAVLEYQRHEDTRMFDAEKKILGFTHCQIGEAVAEKWRFSPEAMRAVAGHHEPEDHPASTITSLIHIANVMGHVIGYTNDPDDLVPRISEFAYDRMGLDWDEIRAVMIEVDAQRQDAELFLN